MYTPKPVSQILKPSGPRSPLWPAARLAHLQAQPVCQACGATIKLEVHHIKPFHLYPELELDPTNFLTLCEDAGATGKREAKNCHFAWGHFYDWYAFNPQVVADTAAWLARVKTAPTTKI